jgi:MFS family permease
MDFGKAFTYVFEDKDWLKKIGIAGVIALISIVLSAIIIGIAGFFLLGGWLIELTRRVIQHDPEPLPDWNDFGGYFMKGLQVFVISLVYSLPVILISGCGNLLPVMMQNSNSNSLATVVSIVTSCTACFSIIYGLFLGIVLPAALGQFAATGQMSSAFRFGEVFGLVRAAPGAYVMVLLGGIIASVITSLGVIACGIGIAFTMAYGMAIDGHLYGQAYNEATAASGLKPA